MIYLYAFLAEDPHGELGGGMCGEPLRGLPCCGAVAVVGRIERPPPPSPHYLEGHDAVVRRLETLAPAVLPARFGQAVPDEAALETRIGGMRRSIRASLEEIAGCSQMTLRIFSDVPPSSRDPDRRASRGRSMTGAQYLRSRHEAHRLRAALPEADPLLEPLRALSRAERIQRHDSPPLLASVYHLVERSRIGAYADRAAAGAREHQGLRVALSGPWAPYAFAPECRG